MGYLTFTRKEGERIQIGDDIVIVITNTRHGSCKISIDAPRSIRVMRSETILKMKKKEARNAEEKN